jgi:hypothetical protein
MVMLAGWLALALLKSHTLAYWDIDNGSRWVH